MQVKNNRVTNIKQKAGPLFDAIDFTTEPSGYSIVIRQVSPLQVVSDNLDADIETGREVMTYLADNPKASQNQIMQALRHRHTRGGSAGSGPSTS